MSLSDFRTAIADRYRLDKELGRGGMATVFLAHDLKHDRPVALKVLHPHIAAVLGSERFQQEIMLAARLQHPHILPVHDSGEAAGNLWFTMPYVEGESLRDRLEREGSLPLDETVRIAREVADALDYAHARGIIHRDIKPENILLSGRHALIADFGIARPISGDKHLTGTGIAVGTPAYMSPEQATADRQLDARTDVYALGCVAHEMLTGKSRKGSAVRSGISPAVDQVIAESTAADPTDRFATAGDFARSLAAAATAESPAGSRRRALFAMLSVGFLLGIGVLFAWSRSRAGARHEKVLAVLPFENLGSPDQEYFADGMTDEVRGKLASLPGGGGTVEVIGRISSVPFKHSTKPPQQIAHELGAQYLLTATVRWETRPGGHSVVHVSPELVEVRGTGAPISKWQQSFDAELTDIFRVQSDIASRVTEALDVALGAKAQAELTARPTANLAAYEAYLRAGNVVATLVNGNALDARRVLPYYERAVSLDSTFALAWAQLSRVHSAIYRFIAVTPADSAAAERAAVRAFALAPQRVESHLAMGDFYRLVVVDNREALRHYEQGDGLAPNNIEIIVSMSRSTRSLGLRETSLQYARRAALLDPRSPQAAYQLGLDLLEIGRDTEALQAFNRGAMVEPRNLDLLEGKALVSLVRGDLPGARAVIGGIPQQDQAAALTYFGIFFDLMWVLTDEQQRRLLGQRPGDFSGDHALWGIVLAQTSALHGDMARARVYADTARRWFASRLPTSDPAIHAFLGLSLAYLGRRAEAIREGERGVALSPPSLDAAWTTYYEHQLARIYILTGEHEKAIALLEKLLSERYFLTPAWLRIDPNFDPLRSDPRFQELIREPSRLRRSG